MASSLRKFRTFLGVELDTQRYCYLYVSDDDFSQFVVDFRKNRVLDDFLPPNSLSLINYKNSFEKVFGVVGNVDSFSPENLFLEEFAIVKLMPPCGSKG